MQLNQKVDSSVAELKHDIGKLDHKVERLGQKIDSSFKRLEQKIDNKFYIMITIQIVSVVLVVAYIIVLLLLK